MSYKLGSLFDGSGGFPLAGALCGIEPVWASEVEPYPIAVTKSRFPNMKHLGDISKINGAEIEPVDIITFGSPCQDLSVAGKRAGLKHEANGDDETTRSGLFIEAVRIIKEMRNATNGEYPRYAIWENVPGAFSSNRGEDFRVVLEELIKVVEPTAVMPEVPQKGWNYADCYTGDGWSLAYRVLDAQYWGVPQRRRRIYLVTDFRGECAKEILFERKGLRGYFTQGRTPWQNPSSYAEGSSRANDREGASVAYGLTTKGNGDAFISKERHTALSTGGGQAGQGYPAAVIPYTLKIRSGVSVDSYGKAAGKGALVQENKSATLGTSQDQYLFQPVGAEGFDAYNQALTGDKSKTLNSVATDSDHVPCVVAETVAPIPLNTLSITHGSGGDLRRGDGIGKPGASQFTISCGHPHAVAYCIGNGQVHDAQRPDEELCKTLNCMDDPMKVCIQIDAPMCYSQQAYDEFIENEVGCTLKARGGTYGGGSETLVQTTAYGFDPGASRDVGTLFIEECGKTLTNGTCPGHHDGVVIATKPHYIVRRLTPTECARLQGFADRWGDIDAIDNFNQKDYRFWLEVRNTHARINGKKEAEYTVKQMLTWYNKLQTDSSEYKMWGNGIALPTALYVMQGVAEALSWAEFEV